MSTSALPIPMRPKAPSLSAAQRVCERGYSCHPTASDTARVLGSWAIKLADLHFKQCPLLEMIEPETHTHTQSPAFLAVCSVHTGPGGRETEIELGECLESTWVSTDIVDIPFLTLPCVCVCVCFLLYLCPAKETPHPSLPRPSGPIQQQNPQTT